MEGEEEVEVGSWGAVVAHANAEVAKVGEVGRVGEGFVGDYATDELGEVERLEGGETVEVAEWYLNV